MARPCGKTAEIREKLKAGWTFSRIANSVRCSYSTISYHAREIGLRRFIKPTYDWKAIQRYADEGHTVRDCSKKFGFHPSSWSVAVAGGLIRAKPKEQPLPLYLRIYGAHEEPSHHNIKKRLLREGFLGNKCAVCGYPPLWEGKSLVLILDHINGNRRDFRLSNLRLVCPNCGSQLETFGSRNWAYQRKRGVA